MNKIKLKLYISKKLSLIKTIWWDCEEWGHLEGTELLYFQFDKGHRIYLLENEIKSIEVYETGGEPTIDPKEIFSMIG
ncbi:TPA_asm: hypothetical protein vir520_00002 [Caudoviricetes sp. vir520]|nr:TPA_asm: hypothetical protein vir520_00002 [Caudoviricetes sp. vir520]